MVHVEDNTVWTGTNGAGELFGNDPTAVKIASLAGLIGPKGARVSAQFPYNYFQGTGANYPLGTNVTSLKVIADNGGNFWLHTHSATYNHLHSAYTVVKSVYSNESGSGAPESHVRGRSGGWTFSLDGSDPYDWVTITQHAGLRLMNSAVMMAHARVPTSMRPYGYTNDEIEKLHHHDAAPGPILSDVATMRIRPFWVNTASTWFEFLNTIYPSTQGYNVGGNVVDIGSVMMIPQPSRTELKGKAEGRTAYTVDSLTVADLNAALTEIWSVYELGRTQQDSITRVWYTHVNPSVLDSNTLQTLSAWVDSINNVMDVGGASPKGSWHNMNEIADLFSHTQSFWY